MSGESNLPSFVGLVIIQQQSQSMSGRALRRLPVLAFARYLGMGSISSRGSDSNGLAPDGADIDIWLDGMAQVIQEQMREREHLHQRQ
jgi:hypothetical protein